MRRRTPEEEELLKMNILFCMSPCPKTYFSILKFLDKFMLI